MKGYLKVLGQFWLYLAIVAIMGLGAWVAISHYGVIGAIVCGVIVLFGAPAITYYSTK